jgi:two-component system cell cycle sensor histidine kinase/response regulator CckA
MEAVGQLAGGIAHDFNNLLQAMLGVIQLGRMKREWSVDDDEILTELSGLVNRGAQLARQLLLFSRRDVPNVTPLDLNEVVNDLQKLLTRLSKENINIKVILEDCVLPINGDRSQLEQVLVNLAVNAFDAMPGGGKLVIATGSDDDHAWIEIVDTGNGMPDDVRNRVFEPFFTTKGRHTGTGLGLSVVHGIVTAHGGTIDVTSEVGLGTTFRVEFPLSSAESHTTIEPAVASDHIAMGRGERILLAEDEPETRRWIAHDLISLGYDVTTAASAEEAEHLLESGAFDLLLSDCVLTGANGPELARRLRQRWPGLKVIFMSGYADDGVVEQARATPRASFLQKPFFIEHLATELRRMLDT